MSTRKWDDREAQDKRLRCGGNDMKEMKVNIQIKMFIPRRRKRSLDDLGGLARVAVSVNSDDGEWVWQPEDLSFDEPVGCYNCLGMIWVRWKVPRGNLR